MPTTPIHPDFRVPGRLRAVGLGVWCILLSGLACGWRSDAWAAPQAGAKPAPITRVEEIRRLSREQAGKALPVRITGVCVWEGFREFVVHDGNESIWLFSRRAHLDGLLPVDFDPRDILIGHGYAIEGFTDPGSYAPVIVPTRITSLGPLPMPAPRRVSAEAMLSGNEDGQFVEVEGVVQEVSRARKNRGATVLSMVVDGHFCRVAAAYGNPEIFSGMVDARVRARGIFAPDANSRSEAVNLKLLIHRAGDLTILEPPPPDPFSAPRVQVSRLMPFSPESRPFNRKVTSGVVVYVVPREFFFLQGGETSIRVASADPSVEVGQQVEVVGFVDTTQTFASLKNGLVRKLGKAAVPPPVATSVAELLSPPGSGRRGRPGTRDLSGRLVSLRGTIRRVDWLEPDRPESIWVDADGQVFRAHFPTSPRIDAKQAGRWQAGAEASFSGICELELSERVLHGRNFRPVGFQLWMAGPEGVEILRAPPWWTPIRLWVAFASAAALLVLALIWNRTLHAMLRQRSRTLEEMMLAHRDSELEFHAARVERQRLAGDLHDGLQQLLVGASYRVEAAAADLQEVPGEVPSSIGENLQTARNAVVRAQEGLRECLWGLRHVEGDAGDFPVLLRHAVYSIDHWPKDAIAIRTLGQVYPLSRHVMGTLLLLVQEAVANAFRHGAASRVDIHVDYEDTRFELTIEDNGSGFDPATVPGPRNGHFGIDSMAHRMQWLGGEFSLESRPGSGTRLRCVLPKSRAQPPPTLAAE